MRGQFTPLRRLLSSSLRRALPQPLQTAATSFPKCDPIPRAFSSLPARRVDTDDGDHRRFPHRAPPAAGRPKSLIEDEAELSDWVSDIKQDSIRFSLSSDGDSDDSDRAPPRSSRGRGRPGGDFDSGPRGRGGRGRVSSFSQRGGRGGRMGVRSDLSSSNEFESEEDGDTYVDRLRRGRGGSISQRGGRMGARNGRSISDDTEDDGGDDFVGRSRRGRGGRGEFSSFSNRGGRGGRMSRSFSGDSEGEEDGDGFIGRSRRGRGGRGEFSSFSNRGGRGGRMSRSFSGDSEGEEEDGDGFVGRSRRGRGGQGEFSSSPNRGGRGGRMSTRHVASDTEGEEGDSEEDSYVSRPGKDRGGRGGVSSNFTRRGGRDVSSRGTNGGGFRRPLPGSDDVDDDDSDDGGSASDFSDDLFGDQDGKQQKSTKDDFGEMVTSPVLASVQSAPRSSFEANDAYLSQSRFDQCSISPLSLKAIKAAGFERMTVVQEATLPVILKGKDVLAKAKTGTGKTVAFLLPAIEAITKLPPVDRGQRNPPINVLIICPTRELAAQAAAEAEILLKFHPSIGAQVVTGGTRLALEQKHMQAKPCQILVATPGRLRDHIENTPGFATQLMGVKVLVLDEADRLLDMGFRKDIEKIVAAVPKQRQTLLFSATVPESVRQVCYIALKRDHEFVNTVEEGSEETNSQVRQMHIIAPLENQFPILYSILTEHISEDIDYKVIVFCTTAMVTKLVADLLSELKLNVREIHSRKPQNYRTKVSKEFRESKGLILVSSDVSARGVDYPDVTLVVQVGVPSDREQYVHRLGRTGRRGKEGKGVLLLAPWEGFFLDSIRNLPITESPLPRLDPDIKRRVEKALAHVEPKNKESAYQAWLGYYNSVKKVAQDKCKLVMLANEFSRSMGLDDPPAIANVILRKMGLSNVPGLRSK